jgi:hypothetical protein
MTDALDKARQEPDLKPSVHEAMSEGLGCWRSCSGCHETVVGQEVGNNPYSETFKCYLGMGCNECGGIGAVWDATDYAHMGDTMAAEMSELDAAKQRISELTVERDNLNALCTIARKSMAAAFKRADESYQAGFLACQKEAAAMVLRAKYQHPTPIEAELNRLVDKIAQAISELKPC